MMDILLNGYDLKKGFCLKRNFIYRDRRNSVKKRLSYHRKQRQNDAHYIL